MTSTAALRCILADDEPLARQRLKRMLAELVQPRCEVVAEAGDAVQAMNALQHHPADVLLLDIHMPGLSGLALAGTLRQSQHPVQVIFVTAHAEHALEAFELHAADYLTKPVRAQRLQDALLRVAPPAAAIAPEAVRDHTVVVQDARRTYRLDLREVLWLRAELKYVIALTASAEHVLTQSLTELEADWPTLFVRVHRHSLVARHALVGLERGAQAPADGAGEVWCAKLSGLPQVVPVSRRLLPQVRQLIQD